MDPFPFLSKIWKAKAYMASGKHSKASKAWNSAYEIMLKNNNKNIWFMVFNTTFNNITVMQHIAILLLPFIINSVSDGFLFMFMSEPILDNYQSF
jgi:hypothetical protein